MHPATSRGEDGFYWAPAEAARTEVDFLLKRGREWLAVEAKSGTHVGPDELRGLCAIDGLPGLKRRVLVNQGPRRLVTNDGIEVWSVAHLHEAVTTGRLWP